MKKLTPFQRHAIRYKAKTEASIERSEMSGGEYELMLAKLIVDLRRIKDTESIVRKIKLKAELLPSYDEWVNGALSSGTGAQDDVLIHMMIWSIDIGDYERALPLIKYNLEHNLSLPDVYSRDITTFVVDEVSDAVLSSQAQEKPIDLKFLENIKNLTDERDYNDLAKAKLYKAIGTEQQRLGQSSEALETLKTALSLNDRIGVKQQISALEKELSSKS